jgi:hypothetical protein
VDKFPGVGGKVDSVHSYWIQLSGIKTDNDTDAAILLISSDLAGFSLKAVNR